MELRVASTSSRTSARPTGSGQQTSTAGPPGAVSVSWQPTGVAQGFVLDTVTQMHIVYNP